MKQIWIIHGGDSFSSYDSYLSYLNSLEIDYERLKPQKRWKDWLTEQIHDADVLTPSFPNKNNAVYEEWKIYFEKLIPFFSDNVRLIGHSLGAMFLAKYLSQNKLPAKARQLVLIAGQYDNYPGEDVGSFEVKNVGSLIDNAEEIHLLHSKDDPVVDFRSLEAFKADLPGAVTHVFEDRGHFNDETFPELLEILKQK